MKNSAIALAVLVLGAACQHGSSSSGTGAGTASAGAPDASQGAQQPSGGGAQASGPLSQDPIMEPGPSIKAHASDDIVTGVISDVSGDAVSIESDRGETRTLSIVPQTTIRVDGHDASADDLAEGQPVRASFNEVEGEEVAVEIRAGRRRAIGRDDAQRRRRHTALRGAERLERSGRAGLGHRCGWYPAPRPVGRRVGPVAGGGVRLRAAARS